MPRYIKITTPESLQRERWELLVELDEDGLIVETKVKEGTGDRGPNKEWADLAQMGGEYAYDLDREVNDLLDEYEAALRDVDAVREIGMGGRALRDAESRVINLRARIAFRMGESYE